MSIVDRINSVDELEPWLKVLVYGDPGAGKTVLACTAPKPLLLDVENGRISLANHPELSHVKILPIQSFNDLDDVFWELKKGNIPDVETVIIDTISELQRRNMDEILISAHAKDNNRNAFLPHQGDYKYNTEIMRRLIVEFRDLEMNLVVTAHRIEDKDDNGRVFVRPQVTPALATTLKGVFSIQGFLTYEFDDEGNFKNSLQVRQTRRVEAKTRVGGLPPNIEMPKFQTLLDAYQKQRERQHELAIQALNVNETEGAV